MDLLHFGVILVEKPILIEQVDVSGINLNSLDYESVIIDGVEHDIFYDNELQMYFIELD